jgi:hypothetical protein
MLAERHERLNALVRINSASKYLEIGVERGATFARVDVPYKVGVDPKFEFDVRECADGQTLFHEVTSDRFFSGLAPAHGPFDLIYLDGLHTFEQTLRDFNNAVHFLAPRGVIVVDDVVPTSYFAALPDLGQFRAIRKVRKDVSDAWMGDVYRLVLFVESFCQQFTYRTVSDNLGQLIVWPVRRAEIRERTVEATARAPYESVLLERDAFRYAPFTTILDEVRGWIGAAGDGKLV